MSQKGHRTCSGGSKHIHILWHVLRVTSPYDLSTVPRSGASRRNAKQDFQEEVLRSNPRRRRNPWRRNPGRTKKKSMEKKKSIKKKNVLAVLQALASS
nr:unnamed protein product [Callosobruchus analis]